ncbi:hypothetical protein JCM13664_08170 [Methylothermus subterraneus]
MRAQILLTVGLLAWGGAGQALEVVIQGKKLVPERESETCVEIAGEYPGIRIEPSEAGKVPQVCYSDARRDILTIHNALFVATEGTVSSVRDGEQTSGTATSGVPEVIVEFQHTFPPGPNGLIMARAKIEGFFATATGLGVASGDTIRFAGSFAQEDQEDYIAEPFIHTVGEELESAIFENKAKKRYLIAGPRTLKAKLTFSFTAAGHKLALTKGASVSIDTGATFEDKLEEMESAEESPKEGEEEAPEEEEAQPPAEEEFSF